ncbi:MAG: DUF2254 domain-containing protein [Hyphomonadaceae bacterium]
MNQWWFFLVRISRRLIVRASAYGAAAVLAALAAVWFAPFVPDELSERLGGPAVENILSALASSLLAVATFSVSAVVVAYTAVSSQFTPRAASFITTDGATQRALATFVGAFLFAVVALVALGANYYGAAGRTILFLATLLMVALVAVTLLGWIDRVTRLAHYGHLLSQIESATRQALDARMARPFLGGRKLEQPSEKGAFVSTQSIGYLANIDPHKLQKLADKLDCTVEVLVAPGDFVDHEQTLARLPELAGLTDEDRAQIRNAFSFSDGRTFEQDPRYGLEVLVEVAARALSPGVNDPRTAVLATESCYRLLADWARRAGVEDAGEPECPRIRARALDGCALLQLSLGEIARYGAADPMVAERVQHTLRALAEMNGAPFERCARAAAATALARAEAAIAFKPDLERVRAAGS